MQYLPKETNPADPAASAQAILQTIPVLMRTVRAEIRRRRPGELTLPQFRTLVCLHEHPGLSLSDVADQLGFLPSSASKTVDVLVERGLVERKVDPADRRRAILSLTEAGATEFAGVCEELQQLLTARLSTLPPARCQAIFDAMQTLHQLFTTGAEPVPTAQPETE